MKENKFDAKDQLEENEGISEQAIPKMLSPREKTVFRMRNLLLTGAALGLAICETSNMGCVMDPPPPPMQCTEGLQTQNYAFQEIFWKAEWTRFLGRPAVRATLTIATQNRDIIVFNESPTVTGGRLKRAKYNRNNDFTILFVPDKDVTSAELSIPLMCEAFESNLQLVLDVSTPAEKGTKVEITF